jgi:hypothetical protein
VNAVWLATRCRIRNFQTVGQDIFVRLPALTPSTSGRCQPSSKASNSMSDGRPFSLRRIVLHVGAQILKRVPPSWPVPGWPTRCSIRSASSRTPDLSLYEGRRVPIWAQGPERQRWGTLRQACQQLIGN